MLGFFDDQNRGQSGDGDFLAAVGECGPVAVIPVQLIAALRQVHGTGNGLFVIIDENLAKAFAKKLGTDPLSQKQIDDLTYFVVPSELAHNVTSLTGIENFKNFK